MAVADLVGKNVSVIVATIDGSMMRYAEKVVKLEEIETLGVTVSEKLAKGKNEFFIPWARLFQIKK